MSAIQTPFGAAAGRYNFLGTMSLENCYVEVQEGGKAKLVILPSDGMVALSSDAGSALRGMIFMDDLDVVYAAHESSIWKISEDGSATRIGSLPGVDRVQMTRNKKSSPQITILTDAALYYVEDDQLRAINSTELPDEVPQSIETLGEYTLLGYADGRVFYSTQGETTQYDALSFFTAEQSADLLVRLMVDGGELFIMNSKTIEVWNFTAANVDEPFTFRVLIQKGLIARDAAARLDSTIMWVGTDAITYRLEGYTAKRVSNHAVERLVRGDSDVDSLLSFAWTHDGHAFMAVKGSDWTRVYDAATSEWHARTSVGLDVWRAQFAVAAWNRSIVGDQLTGKLFYLDPDTYTEDGGAMLFTTTAPPMHAFPKGGIVDRIAIDFLTGQGVTSASATGFAPKLMLSWSDDGGNTWSGARMLELGRQGQYATRVQAFRLGRFRDKGRVWRIAMSDPVGRALANVDCAVRPLAA